LAFETIRLALAQRALSFHRQGASPGVGRVTVGRADRVNNRDVELIRAAPPVEEFMEQEGECRTGLI
jgi:hypothetical protein